MTPGLPLAPSVQCCLDREHLRGSLPGAETGVRPRGAAVNIDSRAHGSWPQLGLGPSIRYNSIPYQGLPDVQLTVNSQSTHSQLDSQLTVNSTVNSTVNGTAKSWICITNFGKQRPPGPPENSFNLIKIIKRGRSPHPSSLSGLMTTPVLQLRNVNQGFCCPVDR